MYYYFRPSPYEEFGVVAEPDLDVHISFQAGRVITDELPSPLVFEVDNDEENPPTDYVEEVIPVMSDRLVRALQAGGVDNLQLFPATLRNPSSGDEWSGYHAVNVVGAITVADPARSQSRDPGGKGVVVVQFRKLVIDERKAAGALMFRVAESPSTLLIHESVKDALVAVKPTLNGINLEEVESA